MLGGPRPFKGTARISLRRACLGVPGERRGLGLGVCYPGEHSKSAEALHLDPEAPQKAPPAQHAVFPPPTPPGGSVTPQEFRANPSLPCPRQDPTAAGEPDLSPGLGPCTHPYSSRARKHRSQGPRLHLYVQEVGPLVPRSHAPALSPPPPSQFLQRKAKGVGGVGLFLVDSGGNVPSLWTGPPVCCLVVRVNERQIRSKK